MKITFMGAGSTVFARNVLGDCMCTPALCEAEIALYDINEERLKDSEIILGAINKNVNESRATIKTYLGVENRKEALRDADFVVNAIQVGGYDPCTITDFEIPKKYGLRQTIADTLGIGVSELHQPDGDADRLYAEIHKDPYRRSLPQRTGMFGETAGKTGDGRQAGRQKRTDRRYQSYGMAAGTA